MSEKTNHQLKIHAQPFHELQSGAKNCEVRNCIGRNFKVGDTVTLSLVDELGLWKQTWLNRTISHIQTGYGLPEGLCVLSYATPDESAKTMKDRVTDLIYKVRTGESLSQQDAEDLVCELKRLRGFELAYLAWHEKTDWVQATQQPKEWGMHRADVLKQRIEQLQALSVTHIMLDVVPGLDGMGEEVYAKSVQDVELAMSRYVNEIEELQTKLENAKK